MRSQRFIVLSLLLCSAANARAWTDTTGKYSVDADLGSSCQAATAPRRLPTR
jgi:hypothetical protein